MMESPPALERRSFTLLRMQIVGNGSEVVVLLVLPRVMLPYNLA
jgi:hypothetical protein